ncbi:MAG: GDSL-type esterase/lipase family protein [Anaerolineae bacterium]|nr:GDSL-type esterase/lipase family protein [Anaerolineae bacterium]
MKTQRGAFNFLAVKKAAGNFVLMCLSLALCFVVCEIVLRLMANKQPNTIASVARFNHEYEMLENIPAIGGYWKGAYVEINSQGLRGHEYALKRPDTTFRILVLGDSFTFGTGVAVQNSFVNRLETYLNQRHQRASGYRYEVLNFGVEGANTFSEYRLLKHEGLRFQPNLVIVGYFMNDVLSMDETAFIQTKPEHKQDRGKKSNSSLQRTLYEVGNQLAKQSMVIDFLGVRTHMLMDKFGIEQGKHAAYWLACFANKHSPGWTESRESLAMMKSLTASGGIHLLVVILPALMTLDENYYFLRAHESIQKFCMANDIDCLDLFPFFKDKNPGDLAVSLTDSHYNAEGHRLVAEAIFNHVRSNCLRKTDH